MMATYRAERRVFDRLKSDMSDQTREEYETAVNTVVERYNTTVRENRFTVGGAVEIFTYALLRSVGIDCHHNAAQATGADIILANKKELSIKSSFKGFANVGLINKQGVGLRKWATATLFVVSDVGIVFGAPDMVNEEDDILDAGDNVQLKKKALKRIADDEDNLIRLNIAQKPPTEKAGLSERQSAVVARHILNEKELASLLEHLDRD